MSSKIIRRLFLGLGLTAVFAAAFWYLGVWSVRRTFQETHFDGLSSLLEASARIALSNADTRYEISQGAPSAGMLDFYARNPEAMKNDKELFRTWSAALSTAESALQHQGPTEWQSSKSVDWISHEDANDAWNHPFCVRFDQNASMV